MKKWICLIAALIILIGALAGCTGTPAEENPSTNAANGQKSEQPTGSSTPEAGISEKGAWPRTITDATGNKVELKERPERIAVLHPLYLDYFFALEKPPIASGNAANAMKEFATLQPYRGKAEIADLGSGRDLNMEAIIASKPDVIVTFKGHVDAQYEELSKIAPVIQIDYSDKWENATMICAQIIGKEELAERLIKETKGMIEKTKAQMGDLKNKSFALLRVDSKSNFTAQGTANTTYYNDTTGFGLMKPNGYPKDGAVLSLEALAEMNPDYIIIQHALDIAKSAVKEKEALAVWQSLNAVKNNHVLFFDNSLNTGSVLAIRLAADNFMKLPK
ncbi:ABC transporter substrate-binding protein [Paenibacillus contaminans]|uniref:Ferrichrome ABC transporter n=1 Tax=Paenibacillus contaminans TaxID=450362 RepID=A0A329MUV3_9BACL|nr:ABC transporter substrate-binding protein [Paenibacillus contaminans]RAV23340.1 ferrichrome ABC transporter [Paenibacillus contaminans]